MESEDGLWVSASLSKGREGQLDSLEEERFSSEEEL